MEPIKEETTPKNKTQKLDNIEIPVKGNSLLRGDKNSEPIKE